MEPRVSDTGTITTVHLVILALLAVVTIVGIVWGIRLKRQRDAAQASEAERVEDEGGAPTDPRTPVTEPAAAPASTPAVAPTITPPPTPPIAPSPLPAGEPGDSTPLSAEPIAAAAPLDASPATVADPTPASAEAEFTAPAGPPLSERPVTLLKGLGPKVAARLADLGVVTIGDLAALDAAQAETIDARLGPFTGRMARDRWIEQARFLAAGDVKGFEAVFGKL